MTEIKTAGVIGLGALGTLYAHLLTEALGKDRVLVLADQARTERYRKNALFSTNFGIFQNSVYYLNRHEQKEGTEPNSISGYMLLFKLLYQSFQQY